MPFSVDDTPFGSLSVTLADVDGTLSASIMATAPATLSLAVYGAPPGVPPNGTEGQILVKASDAAWDTEWVDNYATELRIVARNETGSTLAKGTVVYINGAQGNKPTVTKAIATGDSTSAQTLGMVSADIPNNQNGEVTVRGLLTGLDTSAFAAGTQLYLSGTTAGAVTSTKPSAPVHLVYVGIVSRQHANQGQVEVAIQNGFELHELHDVQIVSPTNGQVLKYDSATGLWKNGTDVGGVAWGGITGTLSAQTDLQNALDAKATAADFLSKAGNLSGLASVSTARTNLGLGSANTVAFRTVNLSEGGADADDTLSQISAATVANGFSLSGSNSAYVESPNNQFVVVDSSQSFLFTKTGFNFHSYPTYDIIQSPSVATSGGELDYVATTGVLTIRVFNNLDSPATDDTITISPAGITFADSTQQTTAFIPGDYLTSTEIGTTYAPLASPTFTGTVTIPAGASISGFAPLASPALTGTPTAPTAAAATNTTQIATTAFVQTSNPAASTTTSGHVELATDSEARTATSTSLALTANSSLWQRMAPAFLEIPRAQMSYTAVGTMGTVQAGVLGTRILMGTSGAASGRIRVFGASQVDQSGSMMSAATLYGINFSKRVHCSGRFWPENNITDPNVTAGWYFGKSEANAAGALSRKGFGWEIVGNATTRYLALVVHDGTTLTSVTSSYVVQALSGTSIDSVFDWDVISDGAGNVTLYVNGSSVATTALGPTGDTSYAGTRPVMWQEELRSSATATAGFAVWFGRGRIYMGL